MPWLVGHVSHLLDLPRALTLGAVLRRDDHRLDRPDQIPLRDERNEGSQRFADLGPVPVDQAQQPDLLSGYRGADGARQLRR